MDKRIDHELEHGKKISQNAEDVWGWGSVAGKIRAERRADYFVQTGKIKATDKVLEIGCGTGLFTEKVYSKTGAHITATELSPELIEQAKKKLPQVSFQTEDAMQMSFADNTFDVVFGSSILHHLDFEKSLKEIYRVLKPGGRMIFAEPNMINPQILIQKNIPFIKKWLGDSPDESAIVRWSYKKLMQKNSFKNINIFPYDFLHPYTPELLIPAVKSIGSLMEKLPLFREVAGSVIIYGEK